MSTVPVTVDVGTAAPGTQRSRSPVPRADAARSLRLVAVSFGVTVVLTRLYLALTGYPQIGGAVYHLAHALWGGLLLLVGGLLALLWGNRWVQQVTAVCVGVGSGLFVDEVGKFITRANDYFTPLAAPIIYVVFLAVLGLATLARRAQLDRPRPRAYAASAVVQGRRRRPADPGRARRPARRPRPRWPPTPSRPDLAAHARAVRPLVEAAPVEPPGHRTRAMRTRLTHLEAVLVPRWLLRIVLAAGSAVLGLLSLLGLVILDRARGPAVPRRPWSSTTRWSRRARGRRCSWSPRRARRRRGPAARRRGGAAPRPRPLGHRDCARAGLVIALAGVNVALGYVDAELVVSRGRRRVRAARCSSNGTGPGSSPGSTEAAPATQPSARRRARRRPPRQRAAQRRGPRAPAAPLVAPRPEPPGEGAQGELAGHPHGPGRLVRGGGDGPRGLRRDDGGRGHVELGRLPVLAGARGGARAAIAAVSACSAIRTRCAATAGNAETGRPNCTRSPV